MTTAFWAGLLALAALWPARLAGALDGAPLDTPLEVIVLGVALPLAAWLAPGAFKHKSTRLLIAALLAWKALLAVTTVQDGWCVRFTSPVPIFVDDLRVPHAWDVRADWRTHPPACSAIMARGYASLNEFPAWFYNLPPDNFRNPARAEEQPPFVTPAITVNGYLTSSRAGTLSIDAGRGVAIGLRVDGQPVDAEVMKQGVSVGPGTHAISVGGTLSGDKWSLVPRWNGADLFSGAIATTAPPGTLDRWLRAGGWFVTPLLVLLLLLTTIRHIAGRVHQPLAVAWVLAATVVMATAGAFGSAAVVRLSPLLLAAVLFLPLDARVRNGWGAALLIGVPFMAMLAALHAREAGVFTWYPVGDDFWMYQRFAYRIYLQGYWLEGGQPTFWFQPLYRWIAGALHMVFGDSSVGEVLWDGACAIAGGLLAFAIARSVASFRWAAAAMIVLLSVLTLGPIWYLFGRGLAEITSMGLLAAAALLALRGRDGSWMPIALSACCATLAFYARLNNLPMSLAIIAFAWPLRYRAGDAWSPRLLFARVSKRVLFGTAVLIAVGLLLFAARTWHYTGVFSLLYGTQGSARSVWQPTDDGQSPLQNAIGSFLMVLTMADPPTFEPRGLPIVVGFIASVLALIRLKPFDRLPMNAVLVCLAGFAGSLVARGSAYPGRFSAHVIPVATGLSLAAIALVVRRRSWS